MLFDITLLVGIVAAFLVFLSKGPAKLVTFTLMCFSDRVNLLNIVCAVVAFNLTILSKLSAWATLLTPIIILISAVVVLLYNVAKFVKLNKDNKDD